eukprot:CFRG5714T1
MSAVFVSVAVVIALSLAFVYYWVFYKPSRHVQYCTRQQVVAKAVHEADPRMKLSSIDLADALRRRAVTSVEMVELYIQQIELVNPFLNAIVGERYDAARQEAMKADTLLDAAAKDTSIDVPFLTGVPCIAKELHEYPGLPYTCGIWGRRDIIGTKMNPAFQRIEKAGAIILCCGNVSEGGMWSESSNPVFGLTSNPYDLTRTCGGSSGGTAAMLAALGGSFSITADVGGSTRIPSLFNGLFGHKPSGGAVPNTRAHPTVNGKVERYCQLGPCTRTAVDLMPVLKIIAGPLDIEVELHDGDEKEVEHELNQIKYMRTFEWPEPADIDVRKLRYFVVWDQPGVATGITSKRSVDMIKAQTDVVQTIKKHLHVDVTPIQFPALNKCFDIWAAMLGTANAGHTFADVLSEGKDTISPLLEILKWIITWGKASEHTLPALGLAVAERVSDLAPARTQEMVALGEQLRDEINEILSDDGVIVFPGIPHVAPPHGPLPNLLYFANYAACGIFNTLELPATAVPVGLSTGGMPVGVQIVGGNGNDHLTIAVAMALENVGLAKWVAPPLRT